MSITQKELKEVLHYDENTGVFTWLKTLAPRGKAGSKAGSSGLRCRIEIRIKGKLYLAHRLAWLYKYGAWPEVIDHIDGDPSNNSIQNLRCASQKENTWNSRIRSNNTSGIKGVRYDKVRGKWSARLKAGGEFKLLKRFNTKEEAIEAYRLAADKYHGEYARYH